MLFHLKRSRNPPVSLQYGSRCRSTCFSPSAMPGGGFPCWAKALQRRADCSRRNQASHASLPIPRAAEMIILSIVMPFIVLPSSMNGGQYALPYEQSGESTRLPTKPRSKFRLYPETAGIVLPLSRPPLSRNNLIHENTGCQRIRWRTHPLASP